MVRLYEKMEFASKKNTPKSVKSGIRHSPYPSGGKNYLNRFKKNVENGNKVNITPPRKFGFARNGESQQRAICGKSFFRGNSVYRPRSLSRGDHILQNSQAQNNFEENTNLVPASKMNGYQSPANPAQRIFKFTESLDTEKDPHNVFSDEEEDDDDVFLSSKHKSKENWKDKENCNLSINKSITKVYSVNSKKRKPINIFKSSILHDVSSPNNSKKIYESEKSSPISEPKLFCPRNDRESSDVEKQTPKSEEKHLKFNSFVDKENVSTEKEDVQSLIEYPHLVGFPNFGNTCYLNAVLQTIVSLHPFSFDLSNTVNSMRFSTTTLTYSLWNVIIAREKRDAQAIRNSLRTMKENVEKVDDSFSGCKMQDANEFLTRVLDTIKDEEEKCAFNNFRKRSVTATPENPPSLISLTSILGETVSPFGPNGACKSPKIYDTPSSSSQLLLKDNSEYVLSDDEVIFITPKHTGTQGKSQPIFSNGLNTPTSSRRVIEDHHHLLNPVTNNFEFQLLESYRCLGCGESEGRKQKHLALYVNLPMDDNESIQDAVESYMSEDQRELTCEKCGHERASFLTSFVELPRVLIVQMKRYEYKPEQLECIKVSSKVDVNLWLQLDEFASEDVSSPHKYVAKPISYFSKRDVKCNTLSVRNLSSELNTCHREEMGLALAQSETQACNINPPEELEVTDQELAEVVIANMEQANNGETPAKTEAELEPDNEEEEFQRAIKLSLQEMGLNYMDEDVADETEQVRQSPKQEEPKNSKHSYHLLSVISHFGMTTCTGHYVSDVLNCGENQWYHYDDESVSSLPEAVVLAERRQKNGYIFFYVHQDVYQELRNDGKESSNC